MKTLRATEMETRPSTSLPQPIHVLYKALLSASYISKIVISGMDKNKKWMVISENLISSVRVLRVALVPTYISIAGSIELCQT